MRKWMLTTLVVFQLAVLPMPPSHAEPAKAQVLFVCEHGNVKSLMAASYFNQLAKERGLEFQAISRGSAPDSDTVPAPIVEGLQRDGINVSGFHPHAVTVADVSTSPHVVTIGTALPSSVALSASHLEQWNDVPAASADFSAARASLKAHIVKLLDQLTLGTK